MPEITLKNYPIKLDNVALPWADSPWKEGYSNIENVGVSEAGTDIVQYTRLGKLKLSLSYTLFASWIPIFEGFAFGGSTIQVSLFDKSSNGYKIYTMRMEDYSKSPMAKSEELKGQYGMWKFSFNLIEM